jgi:tripartite-type tricarboxylate transporter receptor subunit TctC
MRELFTAALFALLALNGAPAQTVSTPPITLVVAFPAGGADDAFGRLLAAKMSEVLSRPVNVDNTGGRGGMVGAQRAAEGKPDGSVLLLGSSATHALSQALYKAPLYNSERDFVPVGLLVEQPMVLLAKRSLPASGLAEFTAYSRPNKIQFGSAGTGSATHIACARLNAAIRADAVHVPYQGGGAAMKALGAGQIDFFCPVITIAVPQIKNGSVKALATLGSKRSSVLPDIPTAQEQGLGNFSATTWFALFAPRGTPQSVVQSLNKVGSAVLESPDVVAKLRDIGADAVTDDLRSPGYLAEFLRSEIAKYRSALINAGIEPID